MLYLALLVRTRGPEVHSSLTGLRHRSSSPRKIYCVCPHNSSEVDRPCQLCPSAERHHESLTLYPYQTPISTETSYWELCLACVCSSWSNHCSSQVWLVLDSRLKWPHAQTLSPLTGIISCTIFHRYSGGVGNCTGNYALSCNRKTVIAKLQ